MFSKYTLAALALAVSMGSSYAQESVYLPEAVTTDAALKAEFARITNSIAKDAPWVKEYGTTTPAQEAELDGKRYQVFSGCKPHNCPAESYVVLYNPDKKQISAGAFVTTDYSSSDIASNTTIQWLGNTDLDHIRILAKYLF